MNEQSSGGTEQYYGDEVTYEAVAGRPDVEEMDSVELVREYEAIQDLVHHSGSSIVDDSAADALHTRKLAIWSELEGRVELDYPSCRNCGASRFGQNWGDPVTCVDCGEPQPPAVAVAVHDEWNKIWSLKGGAST